jgi:Ca2+-binding EF-hand superfamily protein
MRKFLFVAAGIAALAGAGLAVAQERGPRGPMSYDANSDGVLTRQEFDAGHAARFTEMDTNRDGQVTREERRAQHQARREGGEGRRGGHHRAAFSRADANNDGNITREEFLARPNQMFDRIDANRNGVIEASERPQPRQRGEGGPRRERFNPDADNNGSISQAEHTAMGARVFERMDTNSDGRVTQEERQAGRGQRTPAQ